MDEAQNTKIDFKIMEITYGSITGNFEPGWFYQFDQSDTLNGPFPSSQAAHDAAVEVIEQSVAEALESALFGEAA